MYAQKLFNPAITSKAIRHPHPILLNAIDYLTGKRKVVGNVTLGITRTFHFQLRIYAHAHSHAH